MAITNSTTMSELTIAMKGHAMFGLLESSLMAPGAPLHNLMRTYILPKGQVSYQWNVGSAFSIRSVAEGVDHTESQAWNPTGASATATEYVVMSTVTDYGAQAVIDNVDSDIGREMGRAMGNKWDSVVFALNASLDGLTPAGTTNTDLTRDALNLAMNTLRVGNVPGPFTGVFHPLAWNDLVSEDTTYYTTSTTGGVGSLAEHIVTNYFPVDSGIAGLQKMFLTTNIPTGTSANDYSNVIFSGEPCYGAVLQQDPLGGGIWNNRVEEERDASLRGYEIVMTSSFGVAEIRDASALEVYSQSS